MSNSVNGMNNYCSNCSYQNQVTGQSHLLNQHEGHGQQSTPFMLVNIGKNESVLGSISEGKYQEINTAYCNVNNQQFRVFQTYDGIRFVYATPRNTSTLSSQTSELWSSVVPMKLTPISSKADNNTNVPEKNMTPNVTPGIEMGVRLAGQGQIQGQHKQYQHHCQTNTNAITPAAQGQEDKGQLYFKNVPESISNFGDVGPPKDIKAQSNSYSCPNHQRNYDINNNESLFDTSPTQAHCSYYVSPDLKKLGMSFRKSKKNSGSKGLINTSQSSPLSSSQIKANGLQKFSMDANSEEKPKTKTNWNYGDGDEAAKDSSIHLSLDANDSHVGISHLDNCNITDKKRLNSKINGRKPEILLQPARIHPLNHSDQYLTHPHQYLRMGHPDSPCTQANSGTVFQSEWNSNLKSYCSAGRQEQDEGQGQDQHQRDQQYEEYSVCELLASNCAQTIAELLKQPNRSDSQNIVDIKNRVLNFLISANSKLPDAQASGIGDSKSEGAYEAQLSSPSSSQFTAAVAPLATSIAELFRYPHRVPYTSNPRNCNNYACGKDTQGQVSRSLNINESNPNAVSFGIGTSVKTRFAKHAMTDSTMPVPAKNQVLSQNATSFVRDELKEEYFQPPMPGMPKPQQIQIPISVSMSREPNSTSVPVTVATEADNDVKSKVDMNNNVITGSVSKGAVFSLSSSSLNQKSKCDHEHNNCKGEKCHLKSLRTKGERSQSIHKIDLQIQDRNDFNPTLVDPNREGQDEDDPESKYPMWLLVAEIHPDIINAFHLYEEKYANRSIIYRRPVSLVSNLSEDQVQATVTHLILQRVATDELLSVIGKTVLHLKHLDVSGSPAVTNEGVVRLFIKLLKENTTLYMMSSWIYKNFKSMNKVVHTLEHLDFSYTKANFCSRRLVNFLPDSYVYSRNFRIGEGDSFGHHIFCRRMPDLTHQFRTSAAIYTFEIQLRTLVGARGAGQFMRLVENHPWRNCYVAIRAPNKHKNIPFTCKQPINGLITASKDEKRICGEVSFEKGDLVKLYSLFPMEMDFVGKLCPLLIYLTAVLTHSEQSLKQQSMGYLLPNLTYLDTITDPETMLHILQMCPCLKYLKIRIRDGVLTDHDIISCLKNRTASTCKTIREMWLVPAFVKPRQLTLEHISLLDQVTRPSTQSQSSNSPGSSSARRQGVVSTRREKTIVLGNSIQKSSLIRRNSKYLIDGIELIHDAETELLDRSLRLSVNTAKAILWAWPDLQRLGNLAWWTLMNKDDFKHLKEELLENKKNVFIEWENILIPDLDLTSFSSSNWDADTNNH